MNARVNNNKIGSFVFVLSLLASTLCTAGGYHGHGGWGRGPVYSHGYGYGGYGGGYGGGFGFGWGGPNVIINVPVERYYPPAPICENVEVCNSYDECWIERYCN